MEIVCDNILCNKKFRYKWGLAHFKRSKNHYCCRSCQNTTHGLAGTPRHKMWETTKKRAKKKGVLFTLSLFDIPNIPYICPILNIPLRSNDVAGPIDSSPSLDRINPALGYVKGNVRIISYKANRLRNNGNAEELMLVAEDAHRLELKYG